MPGGARMPQSVSGHHSGGGAGVVGVAPQRHLPPHLPCHELLHSGHGLSLPQYILALSPHHVLQGGELVLVLFIYLCRCYYYCFCC